MPSTSSPLARRRRGQRQQLAAGGEAAAVGAAAHQVHRRRADEAGDEGRRRLVVDLVGRADLLDAAGVHDDHPLGQRHRLDLVVGDVERGRAQLAVQLLDLEPHLRAQLGVEVGERLVEQEHRGLAHDRAAHRDALALAAGELARLALEKRRRARGSPPPCRRASSISASGTLRDLQAVGHVVEHASCAGRARSSGTPSRCRAPSARAR